MNDDENLLRRAFAAYFKTATDGMAAQPSNASDVETVDDRSYVVLRNVSGILAVYRVRSHDGVLKRLKRWPASLEAS